MKTEKCTNFYFYKPIVSVCCFSDIFIVYGCFKFIQRFFFRLMGLVGNKWLLSVLYAYCTQRDREYTKVCVYLSYCINYSACVNVRQWPTTMPWRRPRVVRNILLFFASFAPRHKLTYKMVSITNGGETKWFTYDTRCILYTPLQLPITS